jgi:hypothetical protein
VVQAARPAACRCALLLFTIAASKQGNAFLNIKLLVTKINARV